MWTPPQDWKERDAFVIGGGASLKGFDWGKLKWKQTIGCNDAFRLGPEVVQYCLFGDASWFQRNKWDLAKFQGKVVSCAPTLEQVNLAWLLKMARVRDGLQENGPVLAWNYSTGAAAINLAMRLGAVHIYLLGFDLSRTPEGQSHWHAHRNKPTADVAFVRFQRGFKCLSKSLGSLRPDVWVYNVTNGTSKLDVFPCRTFAELDEVLR